MNQQTVSILAILVNLLLTTGKIILGLAFNLTALIAEGIHSGLDIISSIVAFWGIKSAKKPIDKEHPYGHYRAESLAGFVVVIILAISAIWILYEGIIRFIHPETSVLSIWAIILMGVSAVINEIMARLKFYVGVKFSSPALIADGEHSRADVISSIGVLVGIVLIKIWTGADALVAILIGLYILWEAWQIGRQITDSLLDVADPQVEEKIKNLAKEKNIEISELKSRKMGPVTMVDLKIKLDPKLKIAQAASLTDDLQNVLLSKIDKLKSVNITVESHEFQRGMLKTTIGGQLKYQKGFEPIELQKLGYRIIIPLSNGAGSEFGAPSFLVIDKNERGNVARRIKVKNKFYENNAGHGVKFAKAISADEVRSAHIGQNAQNNLDAAKIKFKILSPEKLKKIIDFDK
jgi:cation diffusion facilitator family transporter